MSSVKADFLDFARHDVPVRGWTSTVAESIDAYRTRSWSLPRLEAVTQLTYVLQEYLLCDGLGGQSFAGSA